MLLSIGGHVMDERDAKLMDDLKKRIPATQMQHLRRLVVFGSRAKGMSSDESDLDVIAIVDMKTQELEKTLLEVAYQVMWDNDFRPIISLKIFDEARYSDALRRGYSFYRHVEQEGIAV